MRPKTSEVLALIGKRGVVVGSFPRKGLDAKDLDVVIQERRESRNPVFQDLRARFPEAFGSGLTGHCTIAADPLKVEVFEGIMPLADKAKEAGRMTFGQARRRAVRVDCLGTPMLAVP